MVLRNGGRAAVVVLPSDSARRNDLRQSKEVSSGLLKAVCDLSIQ